MKYENYHGFLSLKDLSLPKGGGIMVNYLSSRSRWEPACIFPNLTEETLFEPNNNQDWNWATEYRGTVPEYMIRNDQIYWNYYVNFNGLPADRKQLLHVIRYAAGGRILNEMNLTVHLDPGNAVFLSNWRDWNGPPVLTYDGMPPNRTSDPEDAPPGWTVANCTFGQPRLTIFGRNEVPPLSYCPGLEGTFEVFLCIKEEILECTIELPGRKAPEWTYVNPRSIPFYKFWKEIHLGKCCFHPEDRITLRQAEPTRFNPLRRFGDIFYIKLIPAEAPAAHRVPTVFLPPDKDLVFYSEPYSMAYYHALQSPEMVETAADIYASLHVDKIVCQMGRTGSIMLYPSPSAVPAHQDRNFQGDDQQTSSGVAEMMQSMNILQVFPPACRRRGIRFIANVGVNCSYRGSPVETRFSADHPEFFHHHLLDFTIPEVIDYASESLAEMACYDIDGLNVQHTRYPYYQTRDTIVALHRKIAEKIGPERRAELELSMSFVADDPEYFQAVEILLRENLIDILIPGRLMSIHPPVDLSPYLKLTRKYGKKLYGLIDGWGYNYVGMNSQALPRPAECRTLAGQYLQAGADGLYFYQSEQILSNPFLKHFIREMHPVARAEQPSPDPDP